MYHGRTSSGSRPPSFYWARPLHGCAYMARLLLRCSDQGECYRITRKFLLMVAGIPRDEGASARTKASAKNSSMSVSNRCSATADDQAGIEFQMRFGLRSPEWRNRLQALGQLLGTAEHMDRLATDSRSLRREVMARYKTSTTNADSQCFPNGDVLRESVIHSTG